MKLDCKDFFLINDMILDYVRKNLKIVLWNNCICELYLLKYEGFKKCNWENIFEVIEIIFEV